MPPSYTPTARLRRLVLFLAALSLLSPKPWPHPHGLGGRGLQSLGYPVSDRGNKAPLCPVRRFCLDPVCGADGVTYWCCYPEAACAGTRVRHGAGTARVGLAQCPSPGMCYWLFMLDTAIMLVFL
uniref:Uncharacterized protein n=1 Tax=Oryza meridionalis TaxID=40149 RepID=A0A0E0EVQ3_9ORYZ